MDLAFMAASVPLLLPGFGMTILVSALALGLATGLGAILGAIRTMVSIANPVAWLIDAQVMFVRCTPFIVQIFAAYFLLPVIGIKLQAFWLGTIALAFNSLGYQAEIARTAIQSIGVGQYDAAAALGLNRWLSLILIVFPQAIRQMLPGLLNEASQLVKASSVLSVISVFELHKAAGAIIGNTFRYVEILTVEALFYLLLVSTLNLLGKIVERNFALGVELNESYQVR